MVVVNQGWLLLFSSRDSMVRPSLVLARVHSQIRTSASFPWAQSGRKGSRMCWVLPGPRALWTPAVLPVPHAKDWRTLPSPQTRDILAQVLQSKALQHSTPPHPSTLPPLATGYISAPQTYLEGSSTRPCGPGWQGFEHHVLHEDLVHLCVLHQHHLHHV